MSDPAPIPVPAATLILYREEDGGPARHLMITRPANMAFAANALVFPGGRVEPGDRDAAANLSLVRNAPPDSEDAAGRVAAIREAIEEVGIGVALDPAPPDHMILAWRARLKEGTPLGDLLADAEIKLDLSRLVPMAYWCPRLHGAKRLFDTRFYVAKFDSVATAIVDPDEATHLCWITARDAIDGRRAGHFHIIFPTMRNLQRLAEHPAFDDMLAHLEHVPMKVISPRIREHDGQRYLCIPEDAGYPVTMVPLSKVEGP